MHPVTALAMTVYHAHNTQETRRRGHPTDQTTPLPLEHELAL